MVLAHLAPSIFLVFSWLIALGWLGQALAALRGMPTLPDLTRIDPGALPPLPESADTHLTIIVPACNEEESIQASLHSLLASTGLRLQIIAVNDRSSDRTGAILNQFASSAGQGEGAHRLQVIHIQVLPAGWLGKPHAMALAARQATSPWLLFTDGDVIFDPRALELSLRHAVARNTDHLVMVPTLILKTIGEAAVLAAMSSLAQWTLHLWKVADPRARAFLGSGTFNLVRRQVYEHLGGFEALRMEVVDDLRLGWLVKRAGFSQSVALGPGLIRIRWLQGALSIVRLAEKNAFAVLRFRLGIALLAALGLAVQVVVPLAALAAGGLASAAGLLAYLSIAMVYLAYRRATRVSPWMAVFFAPATSIVLFAALRSIFLALARKGVVWRGTYYPLSELRRHAGRGW
jgi:cellulose synthase/poly-beta-1,6-N-acetylglucosamine synthase-like glycosyltransferase